jgi:hypothetical protein
MFSSRKIRQSILDGLISGTAEQPTTFKMELSHPGLQYMYSLQLHMHEQ